MTQSNRENYQQTTNINSCTISKNQLLISEQKSIDKRSRKNIKRIKILNFIDKIPNKKKSDSKIGNNLNAFKYNPGIRRNSTEVM